MTNLYLNRIQQVEKFVGHVTGKLGVSFIPTTPVPPMCSTGSRGFLSHRLGTKFEVYRLRVRVDERGSPVVETRVWWYVTITFWCHGRTVELTSD